MTLEQTRLRAGQWEGLLTGAGAVAPELQAVHDGRVLPTPVVTAIDGQAGAYRVSLGIPGDCISDGVQVIVVSALAGGAHLAVIPLMAGRVLDRDMTAEIALLRAELDMLKRAFRQHCATPH